MRRVRISFDLEVPDLLDQQFQSSSVIISTNEGPDVIEAPKFPSRISIVHVSQPPNSWTDDLALALRNATGADVDVQPLDRANLENAICIFVGEAETPFLSTIDSEAFEKIRNLLITSHGVLWLSCSRRVSNQDDEPLYAQANGLLRTLRSEDSTQRCVRLDFDTDPWTKNQITFITHVVRHNLTQRNPLQTSRASTKYRMASCMSLGCIPMQQQTMKLVKYPSPH